MGVQQSPGDISLTGPGGSMLSGGNLGTGTGAPGSPGAAPDTNPAQVGPQHQPTASAAGVSREETEPGGVVRPDVPPRDRATGRFTTAKDPVSGMWRLTPSSRA